MPLPSPYTPGELPRVLAGREVERSLIRERLDRIETLGDSGGPLLVFHAPRGIGKTSLLRAGQSEANSRGFITVWVSCARDAPFLPDLAAGLANGLERAEIVNPRDRARWHARLTKLGVEVGVPGARLSAEVGVDRPSETRTAATAISDLEELLSDAAATVRDRGGAGVMVFVDELHAADRRDLSVLLNGVQNLGGAPQPSPLGVIAAGLPSTPETLTKAATFGERSEFMALDRLSDNYADLALAGPAQQLGVSWDREALGDCRDEAAGYPYLLQVLGHATWRAAGPEAGSVLTRVDVAAGAPAVAGQLAAMFRARWNSAPPLEQLFMKAMADAESRAEEGIERLAIAAGMGRDSDSISVPRDRLIDRGIIEAAGHGRLRFSLPRFSAYVREQVPADSARRGTR